MELQRTDPIAHRAMIALSAAAGAAVLAFFSFVAVISTTHILCTRDTGRLGEAVWDCPEGKAYFVLGLAIAAGAGCLVLVVYVCLDAFRAEADALRGLAKGACLLSATLLILNGLLFLQIGIPLWLAAPYFGAGALPWFFRRRPVPMLLAGFVGVVPLAVFATIFLVSAPAVAAATAAWVAGLLLQLLALRRRAGTLARRTSCG